MSSSRLFRDARPAFSCLGLLVSAFLLLGLTPAQAQNACTDATLSPGTLRIATGNPAYYPWVMDDAPDSKAGFESAVAYEVAARMGFSDDAVVWTRASFDQSIQPGAKDFDFNLQQFSITPEREKVVDFSTPYYTAAQAVLVRRSTVEAGAEPTLASLKELKWGVVATTTAFPIISDRVSPRASPLLYDDNADVVAAMQANQIDAALFDLPTALYLSAVEFEDGVILGQFPEVEEERSDRFGLLMAEGSALRPCVNAALEAMRADGSLETIEAKWLQEATGVPLIR